MSTTSTSTTTLVCEVCEREYERHHSQADRSRFCSRDCQRSQSKGHFSKEELIDDLRSFEKRLDGAVTQAKMTSHGPHSATTYSKYFGSWNEALNAAGLGANSQWVDGPTYTDDELLAELRRLRDELDAPPGFTDVQQLSRIGASTYQRRFGGVPEALREAGLNPYPDSKEVNCQNCGELLRRPNCRADSAKYQFCDSECHREWASTAGTDHWAYKRIEVECSNCGGSLERPPNEVENTERFFCDRNCMGEYRSENYTGEGSPAWTGGYDGYYGKNWVEQRRRARKRDGYRCQTCGISENSHLALHNKQLEVHHVVPHRKFDDEIAANKLSNLLTLCSFCHQRMENHISGTKQGSEDETDPSTCRSPAGKPD